MAYKRSRQAFEVDLQKQSSPYVVYGTPLPPLDEQTRDDGSFVPVWKQEVTDERGRKRLHGAFTGGFSAGQYRAAKDVSNPPQQRPEDFMDEEDMREAEEARTLGTSDEFAGFGTEQDAMRRSAAIDIFRPMEETIGSKLLKRMGWREGQGIGPRIKRAANLGDEEIDTSETHLFAPDDVRIVSLARKTDRKGLGYENELQAAGNTSNNKQGSRQKIVRPDESSDDDTTGPPSSKKSIPQVRRTGIGSGVLNDDSGDEDPYSMGPRISYNKTLGGDKKQKAKAKNAQSSANPLLKTKPTFISKKLASLKGALRKCHDGRLPPDGFVLADQLDSFGTLTLQDDKYKPPQVPADWKSSLSRDRETEADMTFVSTAEAAKASDMTAKARASILGESVLPGKSVFDFITPGARERLATASGRQNLPTAGSEAPPPGFEVSKETSLQSLIPHLDKATALQALNRGVGGWMPYAEDENKRDRYRVYLEIQAGLRQTDGRDELPPRPKGMKQDDWVIEMNEFARAAQVFKPISGLMASRFTSSSSLPQGQNIDSSTASAESLLTKPAGKPQDPAESAARMGMFGPMTRTVSNFYPTRLVCKRFNVPYPEHAASAATDEAGTGPPPAADSSSGLPQFRSFASAGFQQDVSVDQKPAQGIEVGVEPAPAGTAGKRETLPSALHVMDSERNEALEHERPGAAVFKAIFGSDDEDDD
ncbi:hypothetical protein LTR13_008459 [Exophiala sideris]|uniref:G-patch domain-containing protein n=1 Tax=Exophiala sideris TaxID=1016849 RepID=A0ABR0J187_9EURO|nr:hypothetical protein LTR13_008459 [Exophiala sideris]KAK5053641.1 hypothetical protein LTR69_009286 [Exophiala sideris]